MEKLEKLSTTIIQKFMKTRIKFLIKIIVENKIKKMGTWINLMIEKSWKMKIYYTITAQKICKFVSKVAHQPELQFYHTSHLN